MFSPLVEQHKSTLDHYRRTYGSELPPAELEAKLFTYSQNAERTFDPSKNASFKTHLSNHLNKLKRDVHNSGSNFKVSEDVGMSINKIRTSKDELYMMHGQEPTDKEIAKHTGISQKLVSKYSRMSEIKGVVTDKFEGGTNYASVSSMLPDLSKKESLVADTIEQDMSTAEALKHTKMPNTVCYRERNKLRDRMRSSYLRSNTKDM